MFCKDIVWRGLYRQSHDLWCPDAYQHPAKMSVALCFRIIKHLEELGILDKDSVILDPLAGIRCQLGMGLTDMIELNSKNQVGWRGFEPRIRLPGNAFQERRVYRSTTSRQAKRSGEGQCSIPSPLCSFNFQTPLIFSTSLPNFIPTKAKCTARPGYLESLSSPASCISCFRIGTDFGPVFRLSSKKRDSGVLPFSGLGTCMPEKRDGTEFGYPQSEGQIGYLPDRER